MSDQRVVYQFPISHYCEKTRWQLDHKGMPYKVRNLLPGTHRLFTRTRAGVNTLPVLRDGKRLIGDSTRIAYYLEKYYPQVSLLPADSAARQQVIELEQQFDRYGVHVRRWIYGQLLGRPEVMRAMLGPYRLPGVVKKILVPVIEQGVAQLYRIRPEPVAQSQVRMEEGLALIEARIQGDPERYLVGEQLTLADIAAASLYGPLLAPAGTPWDFMDENDLPAGVVAQLHAYRDRPAGQWVLRRYEKDRRVTAA
ncbi:glutathione S-transferase [Alcanivorax sp. S71-1-4]|uniref:glutathione S-transferase family protein n=1 Tax=Alcanivorax sp. S71-1-4 TaxID=1177159 RepID=UPI00135BA28C|nr:glutathione S-transferase family protein [Alcanivorax sp. S71-1-4]KAF0805113.1 glutathione S-transferase [Alcanivorax sp. S71-1-4]